LERPALNPINGPIDLPDAAMLPRSGIPFLRRTMQKEWRRGRPALSGVSCQALRHLRRLEDQRL